ncbi:MAG: hypothetical protein AAF919_18475 [Pseudomonadota bacterium]
MRARLAAIAYLGTAILALPVAAQDVGDCDAWPANARNVAWADDLSATTRTFANGDVRVTLLDTGEPAAAAFHLMVTYGRQQEGYQECRLISLSPGFGFPSLALDKAFASYDPSRGLTLEVPGLTAEGDALLITFTVNRATGEVTIP